MIRLFLGLPGAGKTTTMKRLLLNEPGHRYFVVDHTGDWLPGSKLWGGTTPRNLMVAANALEAAPEEFPRSGIFVFPGWTTEAVARLAIAHGPSVLVDDEADMILRKGWDASPVREFIHRGRHVQNARGEFVEVHMMAATRRPANLHPDFSLVNEVFVFRSMGDLTRDRLLRDAFIATDEQWERICVLEPGQFWFWSHANPEGQFLESSEEDPAGKVPEKR